MLSTVQIELGPTATPFEPYAGKTFPITLPETLYGLPEAQDEVRSDGSGMKRTAILTFTGAENWGVAPLLDGVSHRMALHASYYPKPKVASNDEAANAIATHYIVASAISTYESVEGFSFDVNGNVRIRDSRYSPGDVAPWKAYLAAQYAAGTPVQVLYELEIPQTLTIPPISIPALLGENNVLTDGGGDTTVNWHMDVQPAFEALQAQITALQALLTQP